MSNFENTSQQKKFKFRENKNLECKKENNFYSNTINKHNLRCNKHLCIVNQNRYNSWLITQNNPNSFFKLLDFIA